MYPIVACRMPHVQCSWHYGGKTDKLQNWKNGAHVMIFKVHDNMENFSKSRNFPNNLPKDLLTIYTLKILTHLI